MPHFVTYLGEILDEADTADEAEAIRPRLVDQIMADEVPHLLGPDDFRGALRRPRPDPHHLPPGGLTMPTTTTKIARTWAERLDAGVLTQGQIRELATGIIGKAMGYPDAGHRSKMTPGEADAIIERVAAERPRITAEQTEFGLDWLRRNARRIDGFDVSMLDDFVEFRLHDIVVIDENAWRVVAVPEYAIVTRSGVWVYSYATWQSVGRPEFRIRKLTQGAPS